MIRGGGEKEKKTKWWDEFVFDKTKGGKLELNLTSLLFVRRSLETDNERFVLMMLSSVGEW